MESREKQSKNTQKIIELANKISAQSVEIYESAKVAKDSIQKSSLGVEEVMRKVKDGRGSFLSKVNNLNKIGGLTPKKYCYSEKIKDDLDKENSNEEV